MPQISKCRSLQGKILIVLITVLVFVLSLNSAFNVLSLRNHALGQIQTTAIVLAESLERSIVASGAMQDPALLSKLVQDFNQVQGIHEVYVIDRSYKVIAHPETEKVGTFYRNNDAREAIEEGKNSTEFKLEKGNDKEASAGLFYDVVIPILDGNRTLGAIEVELDMDEINDMLWTVSAQAIGVSLAAILLLLLILNAAMRRIVVRPVTALAKAANKVAAGDFEQAIVEVGGRDEIGLLRQAFTEMVEALKRFSARDRSASPLTGLPGNVCITEELTKRINLRQNFAVLYVDLDKFKAFNDCYGFGRGDEAIKYLAEVIVQAVARNCPAGALTGHIGGDDFVLIVDPPETIPVAQDIIRLFDQGVKDLYNPEDLQRGYIETLNRAGTFTANPIMAISIAIINVPAGIVDNYLELGEIAAELKKQAKQTIGSTYVENRRQYPAKDNNNSRTTG